MNLSLVGTVRMELINSLSTLKLLGQKWDFLSVVLQRGADIVPSLHTDDFIFVRVWTW